MLQYDGTADAIFHALGDPHRRDMVDHLSRGPATVSDLAAPFAMTLTAVVQHVRVLERCGLVISSKSGRVRTCRLQPSAMAVAEEWIAQRRVNWERKLDRLGDFLHDPPPDTDQRNEQ